MLSYKALSKIWIGRSESFIRQRINRIKAKYGLKYGDAELPIDVVIEETGLSKESIYELLDIKKATDGNQ